MTAISQMTDAELDEALAVEAMGWHKECHPPIHFCQMWYDDKGKGTGYAVNGEDDFEAWQPTDREHLHQAVECVEAQDKPFDFRYDPWRGQNKWTILNPDGSRYCDTDNPARALSECVLMAARGGG